MYSKKRALLFSSYAPVIDDPYLNSKDEGIVVLMENRLKAFEDDWVWDITLRGRKSIIKLGSQV